jgi:hypothetical protein
MTSAQDPFRELVAPYGIADTAQFETYRSLATTAPTKSEGYMIDCAITSARTVLQQLRFGIPMGDENVREWSVVAFFDPTTPDDL